MYVQVFLYKFLEGGKYIMVYIVKKLLDAAEGLFFNLKEEL